MKLYKWFEKQRKILWLASIAFSLAFLLIAISISQQIYALMVSPSGDYYQWTGANGQICVGNPYNISDISCNSPKVQP